MAKKSKEVYEIPVIAKGGIMVTNPSEITFWLDEYNDIFSDFDPRPYVQKALSEDFISEAKRASVDKEEEGIQLIFLVPQEQRVVSDEEIIKKRLSEHFTKHAKQLWHQRKLPILKRGWGFILLGIVLMLFATALFFNYDNSSLLRNFFIMLMEPAGWFFLWDGMELILFESKKINPDLGFYRKMSGCRISFRTLPR